jgi:hypothetical protein
MTADHGPEWQVVVRNGRPVWRICCAGLCVEQDSGAAAIAALAALLSAAGQPVPPELLS